ncbi:MAG: ribonucleotide-diphosphate reductase subunit alpha [Magnetococcales bacterium]|nr:ribonucleotide-diphosphate reductase subunit alpha [Magnetococcales bacterium]|tara:strand:- start:93 stop:1883 length:1791 start_codon:yes stop_codon:yes gene_type:complete
MYDIKIDHSRDDKITPFGKSTLQDRYLLPDETIQEAFARVSCAYADDEAHAQRLYDYMSQLWFAPSTPVLVNGGAKRGLPISCFLNEVEDSLDGITNTWMENVWLAAKGGGIGTYWGNVRSIGEKVGRVGKTSGIIPFLRVQDSLTMAISQGSQRRGAAACYLDVSHPEIEEFIEMRKASGGDPNRKAQYLHHGVVVTDDFMEAVRRDDEWALKSPATGQIVKKVSARDIWIRILTARVETGEPYILNIDTVNRAIPSYHKDQNLTVKMSNLCSEITLPTGIDQHGRMRTAVCCLSSVNLENYDEWKDNEYFIEDLMRFLDNILQDFIDRAPEDMKNARYAALRERSVGLGAMGFHSFLQQKMIPFESAMAKSWNKRMFKHLRDQADAASVKLAEERGPCPDAAEALVKERFSNKLAIAPNASSSIYCGNASPGIEPFSGNSFTQKTLDGSFNVRNKYLKKLLAEKGYDDADTWSSITTNEGSVMHLDFLTDEEKDIFKTAFEMDQRWIIEHAADRAEFICQAQSVNLFVPATIHKRDLHMLHFTAWEKGVKSLYYCRSKSIRRAQVVSMTDAKREAAMNVTANEQDKYEECIACQ